MSEPLLAEMIKELEEMRDNPPEIVHVELSQYQSELWNEGYTLALNEAIELINKKRKRDEN
jgi:hypothetical protein